MAFFANKIKSSESVSKQPTQLIAQRKKLGILILQIPNIIYTIIKSPPLRKLIHALLQARAQAPEVVSLGILPPAISIKNI